MWRCHSEAQIKDCAADGMTQQVRCHVLHPLITAGRQAGGAENNAHLQPQGHGAHGHQGILKVSLFSAEALVLCARIQDGLASVFRRRALRFRQILVAMNIFLSVEQQCTRRTTLSWVLSK